MAIEAGRRLGTFEVVSRLGVGGMGEVYLARDSRLGRDVAIKVLPEGVARDAERLARFDREARALAALSHPNVGAIHGAEEAEGIRFLVLELIPGDTLGDRIGRGALKLEEALGLACQVAAAMEAAHERGIVHRDLKPANVKVTPDGRVKVLDFGLARMLAPAGESGDAIATMADHETQHGVLLGTPTYMSPEQARGQTADKRSDVWAFGCLLYEMLSGRKAFVGETVTDVLAAILHRDPDWEALPAATPDAVRRLLSRCLQRDRERRLHDVADARIEMEDVLAALQAGTLEPDGAAPISRRRMLLLAGGGVAAGALMGGAGAILALRPRAGSGPGPRYNLAIPPEAPLIDVFSGSSSLALSPDGRTLAFVGDPAAQKLWVRSLDATRARLLPGTENATNPFFSPDGKWVGFYSSGLVRRVHLDRGEPQGIANTNRMRGASWGEDGRIVFAAFSGGLMIVDTLGTRPQPLTAVAAGSDDVHRWPDVLPGGQGVVFTVMTARDEWRIAAVPMSGGAPRVLAEDGGYPRYVGGHLVFARAGTLMAAPFDARRLRLEATPVPVLEDLRMVTKGSGYAHYAVSATGSLVYVPGYPRPPARALVWVDRKGSLTPLSDRKPYGSPRVSPDGRRILAVIEGERDDLWTYDVARDTWARLTFDGENTSGVWSPDGQQVAFASNRNGPWQVFVMSADGGAARQITTGAEWRYPNSFSPDGKRVACMQQSDDKVEVVITSVDGSAPLQRLGTAAHFEAAPVFSPDGRWIAHLADAGDGYRVFVADARGSGRRWAVSADEGSEPAWSRNGREIFYRKGNTFYAVAVQPGPEFRAGRPRLMFDAALDQGKASVPNWDAAPDGSRFVAVQGPKDELPPLEIVYVPDWVSELRQKLRG
jgi:serine/threonine-protein kinase